MTSVLIADDQEMVRAGLRQMIERDPSLEVVAEAADGAAALDLARSLRPDVCTLDIRMPSLTGLEVTRQLMEEPDPPAVVIVTTFDLDEYLFEALSSGACGFVLKDASAPVLIGAIHAAAQGESLISPGPTRRLIDTYLAKPAAPDDALNRFTPREVAVLAQVCEGLSNDQIAEALNISTSTTKGHLASLMKKTEAPNRVALVIWAFRHTTLAG